MSAWRSVCLKAAAAGAAANVRINLEGLKDEGFKATRDRGRYGWRRRPARPRAPLRQAIAVR